MPEINENFTSGNQWWAGLLNLHQKMGTFQRELQTEWVT